MTLSKKEAVDIILSFNYEELADWIKSRLHGIDGYFPVYEGHDPNLSEFLTEAFQHIKDEKFRDNFIEILGDLTTELRAITRNKKKIEENREYIYELLFLCTGIKKFENKDILYSIARSGKLKMVKAHNLDLHQLLLTALASYRVAGDFDFWIEQMRDASNKYYANAALYALINRQYDLGSIFEHIGVFIERFIGTIDLVWGMRALINRYGGTEVIGSFKKIESTLTQVQKVAVNNMFEEMKYGKLFKILPTPVKKTVYKPLRSAVSLAGEPPLEYETADTLQEKAGKIFNRMGFKVLFDYQVAGYAVDIFIQRKKLFSNDSECYVCRCHEGKRKMDEHEVDRFIQVREAAIGCDAVIVSEAGFTKGAVQLSSANGIILKNLDDLENE